MGTTFSSYRVASKDFFELASIYSSVIQRISLSPGLPVENPSPSLWSKNEAPPDIPVPDKLPAYADVVIIGSGMTGAAFAHTVLERSDDIKSIVVLDARSICGGATGRNGGHCKGETWGDYVSLREKYGNDGAQRIQRFRRTSLKDLLFIDKEYCEGKGDVRNVDTLDCFYTEDGWEGAKEKLAAWRDAMGEDGERKEYTHRIWEGEVARNEWRVSKYCHGVIWSKANIGLLNSYSLVITLWEYLMGTYAKRLQILPYTSVLSIDSPEYKQLPYTIHTSKGPIQTPRIVHATNAHVSHLVPSLRSKVVPVRLAVSVQRPGSKFLPDCKSGMRSWCLYYGKGFDFLGQLPKSPDGWGNGELLYGGGLVFAHNKGLGEAGNLDEATVDPQMESYLAGALPVYFGDSNWGAEGQPTKADIEGGWGEGRIKTVWSGIMGLSSDGPPWVGKLPCSLTPRKVIPEAGGEWVSAGFSGEGMVHAWGCGRGCAMMMLGLKDREGEELPKEFLITEDRVRKTSTEEMFEYLEEA